MVKESVWGYLDDLIIRYPRLKEYKEDIIKAYETIVNCYRNGGKVLIAGNGGSASDAEHIVGELMKSFKKRRRLPEDMINSLVSVDEDMGYYLGDMLEGTLEAISLVSQDSLSTAYSNDVVCDAVYAQKLLGYGTNKDVFIGISTSGNSKNILLAAVTAKAIGMKVIGLSGFTGGKLKMFSDVLVTVPETDAFKVQELHLPIYHCLCLMLEETFFDS